MPGAIFSMITADSPQDRMFLTTSLLQERIQEAMRRREEERRRAAGVGIQSTK